MAYVSSKAENLVLSREAMECLGLVSGLCDSKAASVQHISLASVTDGGGASTPAPSSSGGFRALLNLQYAFHLNYSLRHGAEWEGL